MPTMDTNYNNSHNLVWWFSSFCTSGKIVSYSIEVINLILEYIKRTRSLDWVGWIITSLNIFLQTMIIITDLLLIEQIKCGYKLTGHDLYVNMYIANKLVMNKTMHFSKMLKVDNLSSSDSLYFVILIALLIKEGGKIPESQSSS